MFVTVSMGFTYICSQQQDRALPTTFPTAFLLSLTTPGVSQPGTQVMMTMLSTEPAPVGTGHACNLCALKIKQIWAGVGVSLGLEDGVYSYR